jgi:hypothetical protein
MIPYQAMTFEDFQFYWGESILLYKPEDTWVAVRPITRDDEDGDYLHNTSRILERISSGGGKLVFEQVHGGFERYSIDPLEPFTSDRWITYEPPLGYFFINNRVSLVTCRVPRNRYKGLHIHRLGEVPAVDTSLLPADLQGMVSTHPQFGVDFTQLVKEVVRRLNEPFPTAWYPSIIEALAAKDVTAVVLSESTVFVPDTGFALGHLLHNGSLIGTVRLDDAPTARLVFVPREESTSTIENAVHAWVRSRLTTTVSASPIDVV